MFSVPCNLIVVGVTDKSFNHKLLWTIPKFMDPEEKDHLVTDTVGDKGKTESKTRTEPVIEIFRTTASNILPSVHSAVAAASPIFSSYRSAFQNWKHSVPKLYKYPSSDIEVVVYRKNGEIEKLPHQKSNVDKKRKDADGETGNKVPNSVNCVEATHLTKPIVESCTFNGKLSNFDPATDGEQVDDDLAETAITTDVSSNSTNESVTIKNDHKVETLELYHVPLESSNELPMLEASGFKEDFAKISSLEYNNESNSPNCTFIFNVKPRLSPVPLIEQRLQISKDNSTQTGAMDADAAITSEGKSTQISQEELLAANRKNAENQCDIDNAHFVSNSTQTDMKALVNKLDFSQTFPIMSHAVIQTNELELKTSSVSQTLPIVSHAAIQVGKLEIKTSFATQTFIEEDEKSEIKQIPFQSVEWHTNVPCCNASNQTNPDILNLVKENFCQVTPDVTSKSSQVGDDIAPTTTNEATTNTDVETKDVGVQLSASCCYFTKKRTRKQYEMKLDALREEIRSFYHNRHNQHDQLTIGADAEVAGDENSIKSEGRNNDCSLGSGSGASKSLEVRSLETVRSRKTLEEAAMYIDELGQEVDSLLGNASLLQSNLKSLDETYYEDDIAF